MKLSEKNKEQKEMEITQQLSLVHSYVEEINSNWNFDLENEVQDLENTPFKIGRKGNVYCVLLGNNRISEVTHDLVWLVNEFLIPNWNSILNVIGTVFEIIEQNKKELNEIEKD